LPWFFFTNSGILARHFLGSRNLNLATIKWFFDEVSGGCSGRSDSAQVI